MTPSANENRPPSPRRLASPNALLWRSGRITIGGFLALLTLTALARCTKRSPIEGRWLGTESSAPNQQGYDFYDRQLRLASQLDVVDLKLGVPLMPLPELPTSTRITFVASFGADGRFTSTFAPLNDGLYVVFGDTLILSAPGLPVRRFLMSGDSLYWDSRSETDTSALSDARIVLRRTGDH